MAYSDAARSALRSDLDGIRSAGLRVAFAAPDDQVGVATLRPTAKLPDERGLALSCLTGDQRNLSLTCERGLEVAG